MVKVLKPDYEVNRAINLTLYSLQGGPIESSAMDELNKAAEKIAKKYNLAVSSVVVKRD